MIKHANNKIAVDYNSGAGTIFSLGGQESRRRRRRDRDAEGVEGEGNGKGVSPSPAD